MKYLLDTCTISEVYKDVPNPAVDRWFRENHEENFYLSVLTIGELEKGIHKLPDGKKRHSLTAWLHRVLIPQFEDRLLPINEAVAVTWGQLQAQTEKQGHPLPTIDSLLAATAKTHDLTIATRNSPDMQASGVALFNPWNG